MNTALGSAAPNASFARVDAVRTARLCAIDAFDIAHIRDVSFEDCHVHHLDDTRADRRMVDLNAAPGAFRPIARRSRISGVRLRNVSSDEPARCVVTGRSAEYGVEDVEMTDLRVDGRRLARDAIEQNGFVSGLAVL